MNLQITTRAADYLYKLCVKEDNNPEQIPFVPQKTKSFYSYDFEKMPRKYEPEMEGVSSKHVEAFLHELEGNYETHVHNCLIAKDSHLISVASAPGYNPQIWSLTHSMAKTITSFAIALMIKQGKLTLDTKMVDVFADEYPVIINPRMRQITVKHLLTMTAGVTDVSETASVTISDWKKTFLNSIVQYKPGTRFFYNSMNSYMLACIVEKVSGKTLEEVLNEGLFHYMGIKHFYIEKGPEGIAKGGWGMYIRPTDMLKLGELTLHLGKWNNHQLLPIDYMTEATTKQVEVDKGYGDFNYGYHMWIGRENHIALFNGMLGQNIWVNFENKMIVVSTTGNGEFYQVSPTLDIIKKYFGGSYKPKKYMVSNLIALTSLRLAEDDFFCKRALLPSNGHHEDPHYPKKSAPIDKELKHFVGVYTLEKNNIGVLPLFYRLMQNNHSKGMTQFGLVLQDRKITLTITEGDRVYSIPAGYQAYVYSEQNINGELFGVGASTKVVYNEDGEEILRIDFVFPELPNTRRMKISFKRKDRVSFSFSETPGTEIPTCSVNSVVTNMQARPEFIEFLDQKMKEESLSYKISRLMEPVVYGEKQL